MYLSWLDLNSNPAFRTVRFLMFATDPVDCLSEKKVSTNVNCLTHSVKPWLIQSFLTFDSMNRTLHWKAVEQYFTVVLFVFQFSPALSGVERVNSYLAHLERSTLVSPTTHPELKMCSSFLNPECPH